MLDAFRGTYVMKVDIDDWDAKQLRDAGLSVRGVPAFFRLQDDGRPNGRTITSSVWGDDIPENMAPPLKSFFAQ